MSGFREKIRVSKGRVRGSGRKPRRRTEAVTGIRTRIGIGVGIGSVSNGDRVYPRPGGVAVSK